MDLTKPIEGRAKVNDYGESLEIIIPPQRSFFIFFRILQPAFLLFFYYFILKTNTEDPLYIVILTGMILLFLFFFSVYSAIVKEIIIISSNNFILKKKLINIIIKKEYNLLNIKKFRINIRLSKEEVYKQHVDYPALAFDYNDKRIEFAKGIDKEEAKYILALIKQKGFIKE